VEVLESLRSDLDATVLYDRGRDYQCPYCGHLWHEPWAGGAGTSSGV
jgi:hypothetical protein